MTLFRVQHNKNYVVVNNHICEDNRLSWKAKGLWLYAFSRPDDWQFRMSDICKRATDGRDGVRSGLKELEDFGYLHRDQIHNEKGRFEDAEYTFFETPRDDLKKSLPQTGFPSTVFPSTENPPLLSIKETSIYDDDDNACAHAEKKSNVSEVLRTKDSKGRERESDVQGIIKYLRENKYSDDTIKEAIKRTHSSLEPISNVLKYVESICLRIQAQNAKELAHNPKHKEKIWMNKNKQRLSRNSKSEDIKTSKKPCEIYKEPISELDMSAHPLAILESHMKKQFMQLRS
jgi:hypothetical protein